MYVVPWNKMTPIHVAIMRSQRCMHNSDMYGSHFIPWNYVHVYYGL